MALNKDDKQYIENLFTKLGKRFDNKLDDKLDDQELKFEAKIFKFKSDFHKTIDPIMKEVVASREDRLIGSEQHLRNEKRIEKLEKIHPQGKHLATI